MKQSLEQNLYKTGLDDKESSVYAFLLKKSGGTASQIATETKLNRSTVYKVLLRLSFKGLIAESMKGKKKYYIPENPKKLLRYKKSQSRDIERQTLYVDDLLPKLEEFYNSARTTTQALYYEGDEISKIYDDHVAYKEYELLALANIEAIRHFSNDHSYWKKYIQKKVQNGITTRGFVSDTPEYEKMSMEGYGSVPAWARPVVKKLPTSFFSFEGEYMIYGEDRVSMINLKKGQVSGVIIVDKLFNKMMRNFFDLVWKSQE